MKIPNYDIEDERTDYRQLYDCMPDRCFRMLIRGPFGSRKNNYISI